jgi:DNA mismatch endonuclease (patch repair protein)
MQANVGRVTTAEQLLRASLRNAGLRFRADVRPERDLRCTADIVFRRAKLCVFVDGCFWHGCAKHFVLPKTNSAWWNEKISANRQRDSKQTKLLRQRGWQVIRVWEHQVAPRTVTRIVARLGRYF